MARIAFLHPAFEAPGGAEFLCLRHARAFRERGHEVCLVTLGYDPERWQAQLDGIPLRRVPRRGIGEALVLGSRGGKLWLRSRRAAARMRDIEIAVAHNHPCNAMLGALRRSVRRVWQCNEAPRLLHAREANPHLTARVDTLKGEPLDEASAYWRGFLAGYARYLRPGGTRDRVRRLDLASVRELDHVYAISEFSRDNARRIYGRCAEEVIYPIVDFPDSGEPRGAPDRDALGVLVHSRLGVLKNIDTAIRAFALYHARHPGAHLDIVGQGSMRQRLETLARELMPDGGWRFHGFVPRAELERIYRRADVFCLPTLDEPFGLVFPEAGARGLLLVGPDHGGPLEILEGGRHGWCVDPFDPEAIAEAFEQAGALSAGEAARRREQADRSFRARFSAEVILPALERAVLGPLAALGRPDRRPALRRLPLARGG